MTRHGAVARTGRRGDSRHAASASAAAAYDAPMRATRLAMLSAVILTASMLPPAAQEQPSGFRSPSNNIHCQAFKQDDGHVLRCDLAAMSNKPPPKPKDCELDWGAAFEMTDASKAERLCHGDTAMDNTLPQLAYGASWQRHGFTCKSEQSGVTCSNAKGHGFELSRGKQRVF